jgi:hypothetical protein
LMKIQKPKIWNGLTPNQRNAIESHIQAFGTIVKWNIPFQSVKDWLTHLFYVTETIWQKRKVYLKKRRDWKYHVLSWTKQDAVCEKMSKKWMQNWSLISMKSTCRNEKSGRTRKWSSRIRYPVRRYIIAHHEM